MNNRLVVAISFLLALWPISLCAQNRPDFSGTWVPEHSQHFTTGASTLASGVLQPPNKIKDVAPVVPPALQASHLIGMVVIEATIDTDGAVVNPTILNSFKPLDQSALDAIRQWQFEPARLDGVTIPVTIRAAFGIHGALASPQENKVVIKQNGAQLKVIDNFFGSETTVYRLDGTPIRNRIHVVDKNRPFDAEFRSRWDGDRLTTFVTAPGGDAVERVETRYLDGATMVVDRTTSKAGAEPRGTRQVYDRLTTR
jgi:TonB family protein